MWAEAAECLAFVAAYLPIVFFVDVFAHAYLVARSHR